MWNCRPMYVEVTIPILQIVVFCRILFETEGIKCIFARMAKTECVTSFTDFNPTQLP